MKRTYGTGLPNNLTCGPEKTNASKLVFMVLTGGQWQPILGDQPVFLLLEFVHGTSGNGNGADCVS
jgi:hypothetical protein